MWVREGQKVRSWWETEGEVMVGDETEGEVLVRGHKTKSW